MFLLFFVLPTLIIALWTARLRRLLVYIRYARTTGLPLIISPVGPKDPLWIVSQKILATYLEKLPFNLGQFVKYTKRGWNWKDKNRAHDELGKAFIVVTPAGNSLYVGDATASSILLSRRRDFPKPLEFARRIDVFGQSVASSEGSDWQKHRQITASSFNDRNNTLVWNESLRQTQEMLRCWDSGASEFEVKAILDDTHKLSLNVLMGAGFGVPSSFRDSLDRVKAGFSMTYRDALATCIGDVYMISVVPPFLYSLPWLPGRLSRYRLAVKDFRAYLHQIVASAKMKLRTQEEPEVSLVHNLVRKAKDDEMECLKISSPSQTYLSDSDIYGNLFMFSFAGHETTAMTLGYAIYLLAISPEWQDWIEAEVDHVFAGHDSIETLSYDEMYERLKRCRAIQYEVLRLYPVALSIPRRTGNGATTLKIDGHDYIIPPNTYVHPNVVALHTAPEYWGSDCLEWRPSRWIDINPEPTAHFSPAVDLDCERIISPALKGSYIPWGDGSRICPGKRFSQVEIVASIATIAWRYRISIMRSDGESPQQARERVIRVVEDSGLAFTLRMWESPALVFSKRQRW